MAASLLALFACLHFRRLDADYQTISLPLGSLLALVLGHIILYENVGMAGIGGQTEKSCTLFIFTAIVEKSQDVFFYFFYVSSIIY